MKFVYGLIGRRQALAGIFGAVMAVVFNGFSKFFSLFLSDNMAQASAGPETAKARELRAIVVFYSATGSTARAAHAIKRGIQAVMPCDISAVKKIDPKEMAKYDLIAIGGPIWYFRETANLRLFVYNMPSMKGKLCIPFCTHGGGPEGFFYSLGKALRKKGFSIIGWNDWYGSVFHVLHQPKPYYTDGHPDEIDLREAEQFGREMAERAQRIYAGEKNLIPEIPVGEDADSLWQPGMLEQPAIMKQAANSMQIPLEGDSQGGGQPMPAMEGGGMPEMPGGGGGPESGQQMPAMDGAPGGGAPGGGAPGGGAPGGGMGPSTETNTDFPEIDLTKCVYPRCSACADNCPAYAIDLSLAATASGASGSRLLVKEACFHCDYPMCQRACAYDAIIYKSKTTQHAIDTAKCTYPKCTLCADNCPMDAIDLTQNPPLFHNNCIGGDVCWCICPEDAITIPNLLDTRHATAIGGAQPRPANMPEYSDQDIQHGFRRLVPLDVIGYDMPTLLNPNIPRLVLKEDDWPEMRDRNGKVFNNVWPH